MLQRFTFVALLLLSVFGFCTNLHAQLVQEFNPPKAGCCLTYAAERLAGELQDWNQLGRYHQDDLRLEARPRVPGRVVFLGDSITDIWNLEKFFPGKPYVNRGISGQTTPQMLVRMMPDVVDLKPAAVILLAGTNDIAGNTGPETAKMIEENFEAITELAQAHQIKVILCSLTPVSDYTSHPQTVHRPPAQILELNAWIKSYAAKVHAAFADYYSALVDSKGMLKNGYSNDGLHPNDRGFALLAPVAEAAIEKALHEKR
ncbi:MAG: SGNH/GDSL hydrolase family protein [Acidobacteria bacterium]|nr:SGNH/GDSL hydrolase family protein [Acidobacteriota bacterium]